MNQKGWLWALGLGILLFALRDLAGWATLGNHFTPFSAGTTISASVWDESASYAPAVSSLLARGQFYADDLKENRNQSLPLPIAHAWLVAPLAKLVGLRAAWCVARAGFAALSFVLLYLIFSTAMSSLPGRLLAAALTTTVPFAPRNMLLRGQFSLIQPLELTRFANPGLSFAVLLSFVILAKKFLETGARRYGVAGGILLGLLPYCYYYYTVSVAVGFGALWILLATQKQWEGFRRLSQMIAIAAIVALPYLLVLIRAQPFVGQTLIPRVGMLTRQPEYWGVALCLGALAWAIGQTGRGRSLRYDTLFLFLLAGAGAGLNLQVLTGYEPQHGHYWNRLIQPIGCAVLLMQFATVVNQGAIRLPRLASQAMALLLFGIVYAVAGYRQVSSVRTTIDDHDRRAPFYRALEWVRDHTPREAVVGSTERQVIALTPTVTGRWSFVPFGLRTSASVPEIMGRYFSLAKLEGKGWDEIETTWHFKQFDRLWAEPYFVLFHNAMPPIPELLTSARQYWERFDAPGFLASRQLDYAITQRALPGKVEFEDRGWKVIAISPPSPPDVVKKN